MDYFFKPVLSKGDEEPTGHSSAKTPPLPCRSYLFTVFLIIQAFSLLSFISAGGWCLVECLGQVSQDLEHCRYIHLIVV